MTSPAESREAASGVREVLVWDPIVRLFHWGVVLCCALDLFLLAPGKAAHRYVGYAALLLLAVRFVWGFIGTRYARFADFVRAPPVVLRYARAAATGTAERHIGHNPAAGWMMVLLMALLAVVIVSGWLTTLDAFWGNETLEEAHEFVANSIMVLAGVHAAAAIFESWHLKENLIWSMVTGRKKA
ncbi:cytochrome b/b6 domain-containing protein [Sinorhizobium terangae]|uniref:cytochrome b/b6 domain-containing protein n=1 Tax=Sinorhizobium terangae TaxID=110322 RepID=UPI0024B096FB|nr:cytochrome b/b6 domain-containing protein [Sinorhizobium terangae]WFU49876.1 cytochrome b/b6 domain-containing protein [Sinorhizobium terangae]